MAERVRRAGRSDGGAPVWDTPEKGNEQGYCSVRGGRVFVMEGARGDGDDGVSLGSPFF
jgi:hypothetical protein